MKCGGGCDLIPGDYIYIISICKNIILKTPFLLVVLLTNFRCGVLFGCCCCLKQGLSIEFLTVLSLLI